MFPASFLLLTGHIVSHRILTMGLLKGYIERYELTASLSACEYRIFLAIADSNYTEVRCGRIIKDTEFSKLQVSRGLASLKKKDLIYEDKYPHDKRQCNLHMTQAGKNLKLRMLELENDACLHTHTEENDEDQKKRKELASGRTRSG